MATQNWVPLIEYSNRYNISLSTLRRRIKSHSILFKLENGKYFILDDQNMHSSHVQTTTESSNTSNVGLSEMPTIEASVLTSAHRLVEELKAAYAKILQEKEEQIGILKEQILDLNMLVNLLEKQNECKNLNLESNTSKVKEKQEESQSSSLPIESFYFPEIEN